MSGGWIIDYFGLAFYRLTLLACAKVSSLIVLGEGTCCDDVFFDTDSGQLSATGINRIISEINSRNRPYFAIVVHNTWARGTHLVGANEFEHTYTTTHNQQ